MTRPDPRRAHTPDARARGAQDGHREHMRGHSIGHSIGHSGGHIVIASDKFKGSLTASEVAAGREGGR